MEERPTGTAPNQGFLQELFIQKTLSLLFSLSLSHFGSCLSLSLSYFGGLSLSFFLCLSLFLFLSLSLSSLSISFYLSLCLSIYFYLYLSLFTNWSCESSFLMGRM